MCGQKIATQFVVRNSQHASLYTQEINKQTVPQAMLGTPTKIIRTPNFTVLTTFLHRFCLLSPCVPDEALNFTQLNNPEHQTDPS